MDQVTIDREKLLAIVQENKTKYLAALDEAIGAYWENAKLLIAEAQAELDSKKQLSPFRLAYPPDHTEDYDTAIRMLELSVEPTATLRTPDFDALVRNRWPWRDQFKNVVSSCAVGAKIANDAF